MRLRTLLLSGLAIAFGMQEARAQSSPSGWEFSFTPYVWVASLSGSMRTPHGNSPSGMAVADFGTNLASNLSGFAFMGAAEARYGRFGFVADLMYFTVSEDFRTPREDLFNGGNARVSSTTFSLYGYYRVAEEPWLALDLGVGARGYWIDTRVRLNPGALPGGTASPSYNWVDPLVTARAQIRFAPQWGMTVFGDVGGFSVGSTASWQLGATIDWRPASWVDLRAGWRYMAIDYSGSRGASLDLSFNGPIIGATFRF